MRHQERAIVHSTAGSMTLLLLCIAAFHLFGPTPLWTATRFRSLEFNPSYLPWVLASVPAGSLVGCIAGARQLRWWELVVSWLAGSFGGAWVTLVVVTLIGVAEPLWVCSIGLAIVGFVTWLLLRKPKSLAEQIRSFDV